MVRPPRIQQEPVEPLTLDEVQRILAAARDSRHGTRWAIALALGLRQGEASRTRPSPIDVKKLLVVTDATARHLWMWVEPSDGLAMIRSFEAEGLPDVNLDAEGIDGAWLGRSPAPDVVSGHSWLRGLRWSEFPVARNEVVDA